MHLLTKLICTALVGVSPLAAQDNLIQNPGFEEQEFGWKLNNWDGMPATYTFVEDDVHSGKYALRMELERNTKGTNIQLYQMLNGKVGPEDSVKLSFWIKGTDNAAPVDVALAQNRAPWKDYVLQPIVVDDSWRQHEIYWTPGEGVDFETLRVNFYVREEMVVLLDDIELTLIDEKMGGEVLPGNRIANHSFELGRDRWYFSVRPDGAWSRAHIDTAGWVAYDSLERPAVQVNEEASDGARALKLNVGEHMLGQASSAYFELRYGHPVRIRFDVRADSAGKSFEATVSTTGGYAQRVVESKYFGSTDDGWKTYEFTITPKPSTGNLYTFELLFRQPGTFWIDQIVINEASLDPEPNYPDPELGWIKPDANYGHIYGLGESLHLDLIADSNGYEDQSFHGRYEVIDVYGHAVADGKFETTPGEQLGAMARLDLPTERYGAYKLRAWLEGTAPGSLPDVEWQYLILPELAPLETVTDHFFGGHSPLTEEALWVAEKVGLRSIRMHPPLATKWRTLEIAPGEWNFENPRVGLERAHSKGFDLLGSLDTAPDFHAGIPMPRPRKTWMGWGNYPPKDLSLWQDYVARTVAAFDDLIDTWEVWNEPDNHFLEGPSYPELQGTTKPKFYKNLVKHARTAIEEGGFDKILIAGAVARLEAPFTVEVLDENVTDHADVFSFHVYGGTITEDRLRLIREAQAQLGRSGKPVGVWQTEGAYFPTIVSWLESPRIPKAKPELAGRMTDLTVIRMLEMKASHVKRNYHYPTPFASQTGRHIYRNEFACGYDVAGNPLPIWAAHAACVKMLEGAEPIGYTPATRVIEGVPVRVARFVRGDDRIEAIWAEGAVDFDAVEMVNKHDATKIYDIMANPITLDSIAELTTSPIYFVSPR